jgi:hypothetical protein
MGTKQYNDYLQDEYNKQLDEDEPDVRFGDCPDGSTEFEDTYYVGDNMNEEYYDDEEEYDETSNSNT